jgi:hypothetical protein
VIAVSELRATTRLAGLLATQAGGRLTRCAASAMFMPHSHKGTGRPICNTRRQCSIGFGPDHCTRSSTRLAGPGLFGRAWRRLRAGYVADAIGWEPNPGTGGSRRNRKFALCPTESVGSALLCTSAARGAAKAMSKSI